MATYTPGSASDLDSLDSIKKVQEYLIKQERKLDYMFNNLDPQDNYSEQARLIMVEDGERQASIEVSLNQIALNYVSKSGVVSAINLSEEMIQIEASKIKLEGMVTVNGYFKVGLDGSIEARNGKFSGDISASTIRGSHIYSSYYGTNQDDFYIVETETGTEIGFAGFEGWGDKILRSHTLGSWENPASQDDSRIALNSNNGAAGFTYLYVMGVRNDIASEISAIWDAIESIDDGGGDEEGGGESGGGDEPISGNGDVEGTDANINP